MDSAAQEQKNNKRYLPRIVSRKEGAVKRYCQTKDMDFVLRALLCFGYAPDMIRTDNGGELILTKKTKRIHPSEVLCNSLHIVRKTIRPKTPRHNGKVERNRERFYTHFKFCSYEALQLQIKRHLQRSNRIPMSVLGWQSPVQKRQEPEAARFF